MFSVVLCCSNRSSHATTRHSNMSQQMERKDIQTTLGQFTGAGCHRGVLFGWNGGENRIMEVFSMIDIKHEETLSAQSETQQFSRKEMSSVLNTFPLFRNTRRPSIWEIAASVRRHLHGRCDLWLDSQCCSRQVRPGTFPLSRRADVLLPGQILHFGRCLGVAISRRNK